VIFIQQHITPEMLSELTDEQKERLREWWEPQVGDICEYFINEYFVVIRVEDNWVWLTDDYQRHERISKNICLPLLSIGQCIELLREKDYIAVIFPTDKDWRMTRKSSSPKFNFEYSGTELIIALWQAAKSIL